MRFFVRIAISIASTSCSSSPKHEPQPSTIPAVASPSDAAEAIAKATPDTAASATVIDDKHPRIFSWESWRERNEKWLATLPESHCDPRNDHVRRKGEAECYPPHNVQLAAIVIEQRFLGNDTKIIELTVDRGYRASVNAYSFISLLDAQGRPATRWVHPTEVEDYISKFVIPYPRGLDLHMDKSRAAIVESLTSDDRFPEDDPRSAP